MQDDQLIETVQAPPAVSGPMDLDSCVLRHVSRLSRAVVAAYDPALAKHGLTGHQFNLMTTLNRMGPMSVGDLASALGMDPSGVPRAIRPLTEAGWLATETGEDRRRRVLRVTEAGAERLAQAHDAWASVQAELVKGVGDENWLALVDAMRGLRKTAAGASTRVRS
jgi:DNA-binding MarR family transcriptional regulator